ncbi:hypothetical protein IWX90DRAFT_127325 [Phyllosticta citrichinensis]|uniref:Uncharacterized protein n=1 Tax=Phyllosticta citrichinensis TaxID=1130410 RepID=A0ABR1Y4F9_9PEZI
MVTLLILCVVASLLAFTAATALGLPLSFLYAGESAGLIFKRLATLATVFGQLNWAAVLTMYLSWRRRVDRRECLPVRGWGQPYCAAGYLGVFLFVGMFCGAKWWKSEKTDLVNRTEWGSRIPDVPLWVGSVLAPQAGGVYERLQRWDGEQLPSILRGPLSPGRHLVCDSHYE